MVSSGLIDRVAARLGRRLYEVPVGFKWFADGLFDGSLGFGGEESAGASFLRKDGGVWSTDKDGLIPALLAAEMTARTGRDPSQAYAALTAELGEPFAVRVDAKASPEQKALLGKLAPEQVKSTELAGEAIQQILSIIPERIGVHFKPQPANDEHSRHLAVLYRDAPQSLLQPGEMAVPVGSLFAVDQHGQPLLRQWVRLSQGKDDEDALLAFFRDYASIAVPALLGMYLRYGVAFEAHQQNSFMVMAADGQLSRLLLRDFGDIRIDRKTLHAHGLDIELHDPKMTLYDDAGFVRDKLLHTVFMCHLGELVLLSARHFDIPQARLWNELSTQVSQCFDDLRSEVDPQRWKTEREALLEQDWPAKSFMRMRLLESHADIVGRLPNPLSAAANAG